VQAQLRLLPSLKRLALWYEASTICLDQVIGMLQSLPPMLQSLLFVCDGVRSRPPLTQQLVEASKPAHMRLVEWCNSPLYPECVLHKTSLMRPTHRFP
jgi:hypothetical protein